MLRDGTELNKVTLKDKEVRKLINGDRVIQTYLDTLNSIHTKRSFARAIYEFYTFLYGEEYLSLDMMVIDPMTANKYTMYWKKEFEDGKIKASTFNSKLKGIKLFYDWLITETSSNIAEYRVFIVNPFANCSQVQENDSEGSEPLTPEEVLLMLNNPYGSTPHITERNTLMFILAIVTGIRNTALITITESDIKEYSGDYVMFAEDKEGKTAKMSITPYYNRLMDWYRVDKMLRGGKDNDTIFNITPITANRIIKVWSESVGLTHKKITFHSLRTTTAVQIFHNTNGNVYKVQKALNHSHISTSNIYLGKENVVNHDGENIIENIVNSDKSFNDKINSMTREQLIDIIMGLPMNDKINIMAKL